MLDSYPTITVVIPSFNQSQYLERTICSVLDQNYPKLELIIIDGGSSDGSVDIIHKYSERLAYWISEKDRGQVDAINKGLKRATGKWVCWQNSDDVFYPGSFLSLVEASAKYPNAGLIIGNMMLIDENDRPLRDLLYITPDHDALLAEGMLLANQAAFWRRDLQGRVGLLDETYLCSFDYDWFLRITAACIGVHVNLTWGGFRLHSQSKTAKLAKLFIEENRRILSGREVSTLKRRFYQMRRMCEMLFRGDLFYVYRGIARRIINPNGMG